MYGRNGPPAERLICFQGGDAETKLDEAEVGGGPLQKWMAV